MLASYLDEGTRVEAAWEGEWRPGSVNSIDRGDDALPYSIRFDDETIGIMWIAAGNVRIPQTPEPPKVTQYRFRSGSRWAEWQRLDHGQTIPIMHNYTAFQIREHVARTDAEIVARLRERGSRVTMTELSAIVAGNF